MSKGLIELKWLEFGNAKLTGVRVTNPAAALDEVIGWWNPVNKMKCVKNRHSDILVQATYVRALSLKVEWNVDWISGTNISMGWHQNTVVLQGKVVEFEKEK